MVLYSRRVKPINDVLSAKIGNEAPYILNTIQYNTIQYNTIQYNTIQYNTIQYNTIQYNTIQYNTIQYNTIQYNTIQYNTIQTIHYTTIQYNTYYILLKFSETWENLNTRHLNRQTVNLILPPYAITPLQINRSILI